MLIKKLKSIFEILETRGATILLKSIKNYLKLIIQRDLLNRKEIVCKVNNYKMSLLTNDRGISRSLILFETRENDKQYILESIIKKKMNIFDIGSNIGYYTIFLKKKIDGSLLAIEPSIENLTLCKKNLKINKINTKKIFFLNAAVSNQNSLKKLYIARQTNLHTLNPEGSAKDHLIGEVRKIKTYSVYSLAQKYFKPDLIRMDVEGHECEIISGMLKYIKSNFFKPHICFEPHISSYSKKNNFAKILKELFKLGYFTKLISSNAESGSKRISKISAQKDPFTILSDGEKRGIFKNINNEETIKILTEIGGARTVLLSPFSES
tara:strand:+ start:2682 stop:3650 length:969 start_codon:yes stop_codon:yes gene_type:complete